MLNLYYIGRLKVTIIRSETASIQDLAEFCQILSIKPDTKSRYDFFRSGDMKFYLCMVLWSRLNSYSCVDIIYTNLNGWGARFVPFCKRKQFLLF